MDWLGRTERPGYEGVEALKPGAPGNRSVVKGEATSCDEMGFRASTHHHFSPSEPKERGRRRYG